MINKVGRFCLAKGVKLVWLFQIKTVSLPDRTFERIKNMKKISLLSVCLLCLLSLSAWAEVTPVDTIPFELGADNRLYVTVYINGQDDRPPALCAGHGSDGCGAQFQFAAHRRAGCLYGK